METRVLSYWGEQNPCSMENEVSRQHCTNGFWKHHFYSPGQHPTGMLIRPSAKVAVLWISHASKLWAMTRFQWRLTSSALLIILSRFRYSLFYSFLRPRSLQSDSPRPHNSAILSMPFKEQLHAPPNYAF